ncbi:lactonase family protein [Salipiger sp.]|uniref:lactonase family protein n=1 Tax=Salipiger sp. TaxID=2078585 RepID=UPI003A97BED3
MGGGIFLYASEAGGNRVSVFSLDPLSGALARIQEAELDGPVMPLALSKDRTQLYASLREEPWRIARFAIDGATGTLTLLDVAEAAHSTVYLTTERSGCWLIGACNPPRSQRRTGILSLNRLAPDGAVTQPPAILRTSAKLHCAIPDPTNRFVLATSCDSDLILRYRLDTTRGRLSADGLAPVMTLPKAGPRHLQFHPNGRFLYAVNEYDGCVVAWEFDTADGSLHEIQIASAVPPGFVHPNVEAADLAFTPDGRWLFASVRECNTIAVFGADPGTGRLALAGHHETARTPRSLAVDPGGRFLYAAGQLSACIAAFRIDPETGALDRMADTATGEGPNWLEIVALP